MSKEFHIFKQNTEAIATNRGFYYQYLKAVKLWLDNYVNGVDNEIYCEREDDIFEHNPISQTYKFRQIKCYSTASGLNSLEVKSSLLNFYMLYLKYDYEGLFYFESNTTIQPRAGKNLTQWIEQQQNGDFSVTNYLEDIKEIFGTYIQEKLDAFLKGKTKEEQDEAQQKADKFFQGLTEPSFEKFLESIRWVFSNELDTHKAIANLSEEILNIIDEKQYNNKVDKELLLGYLVNVVLEKSIESDEEKRLLTNDLLKVSLDKTEIDDSSFRSEVKELLKANFFIPHSLTETFKKEELFIGREREFEEMRAFFKNENSLLLVHSIGGMGKTTLVKEFLSNEQHHYAHYGYMFGGADIKQSWVNSGFRKSLSLVMEKTDDTFTESMVALQALEGKTLLVIDNIENIENQEDELEKIVGLAQNPNFDIVMTSREIIEDVHKPYELKALSKEDAKSLFNSIYEVDDEGLLEEVLEYLDWHTFFIEKVAQTLKNKKGLLSLQDIKDKFDNQEFPSISFKKKKSFNELLTKLFTLDELEDDEILLLKQLSILPSIDIEFEFLKQIFQVADEVKFQEDLEYLNEKGWLIYSDGSYKLHQMIKEFMLLEENLACIEEIANVIHYFNLLLHEDVNTKIPIFYLNKLIYVQSIFNYLTLKEEWNEDILILFLKIGNIYIVLGKPLFGKLYFDTALKIFNNLETLDKKYLVSIYSDFSSMYTSLGLFRESLSYQKKCIEVSETCSLTVTDEILIYSNLATTYKSLGEYNTSLNYYNKSLSFDNGNDDSLKIALVYKGLAEIYKMQGEYNKAIENFNKVLKIRKKFLVSNHYYIAQCYNDLAFVYSDLGKTKLAIYFYKKAIKSYEENFGKNHIRVATIYRNLAESYRVIEDYENFLSLIYKVLDIEEKELDKYHIDRAITYNTLAVYFDSQKNDNEALKYYLKSLRILESHLDKNHPHIAITYHNLVIYFYRLKNYIKAYEYISKNINAYKNREHFLHLTKEDTLMFKDIIEWIKKNNLKLLSPKRNDPCHCNSGKKYKKCCGKNN